MDTKISFLILCLVVAWSDAALRDFLDDTDLGIHARRIARAAEADDYDIATLYGKNLKSGERRWLTKRDVVEHASHPSTDARDFELHLTSGERLRMLLQKRVVIDSKTKVVEHFLDEAVAFRPTIRDCFFSGVLEEKGGHASLALCDGQVVGVIHTNSRDFQLHPLPMQVRGKRSIINDLPLRVLVTWSNTTDDENDFWYEDDTLNVPEDETYSEQLETLPDARSAVVKRSVEDRKVTVEVGIYLDKPYVNTVGVKLGLTSNQELTELMALKWSGVAAVLSNVSLVGWDVTIKVVSVEIWRENPAWYNDSIRSLGGRLGMICSNTQKEPFDYVLLETADTDKPRQLGLSYVSTVCNPRWRCSVVKGANFRHTTEIHEFGHSLGLNHDNQMSVCPRGEKGMMGFAQLVFRECYAQVFNNKFRESGKSCLFRENVDVKQYNHIDNIVPQLEGQVYSFDNQCRFKHGEDFEYFPTERTPCGQITCRSKSRLGELVASDVLLGAPCGQEQMCNGEMNCVGWVNTLNHTYLRSQVVNGGWGPWSEFSSCNKTCGAAVSYSTRKCNKPAPHLTAYCVGDVVKAELCPEQQACPNESGEESKLIAQRADSLCTRVRDSGLSSYNLTGTGKLIDDTGAVDSCTVTCDVSDGSSAGRYALSDGTPCRVQTSDDSSPQGVERRCVQGRCLEFGCNRKTTGEGGGLRSDRCGVCGGDGSTC